MKKILKFTAEEGNTQCGECPISAYCKFHSNLDDIPCDRYDLTTLDYIGDEDYPEV